LVWGNSSNNYIVRFKENWIQGGDNRSSEHFAVTFLDCWRTSFCVTTIIKIVNNNTNDKKTFGASLASDEDSPYTNSWLFTFDRLPLLLCYAKTSSPAVQKRHSKVYGNPIAPFLYSILLGSTLKVPMVHSCKQYKYLLHCN